MNKETFDWDDTITNDGVERTLLPEGDYPFVVSKLERGSFPGSTKMSPCPKATLTLTVNGTAVHDTLFLHKSMEWRLSQYFRSLGFKKPGESLVMPWSKVVGATGMVHITVTEYTDKYGNVQKANKVGKYLDPAVDDETFYEDAEAEDDDDYLPFD